MDVAATPAEMGIFGWAAAPLVFLARVLEAGILDRKQPPPLGRSGARGRPPPFGLTVGGEGLLFVLRDVPLHARGESAEHHGDRLGAGRHLECDVPPDAVAGGLGP